MNKLILYLNVKKDIKDSLRLVQMIFFLGMYLHFVGCIWYFIVDIDKIWIPSYDYIYGWEA